MSGSFLVQMLAQKEFSSVVGLHASVFHTEGET